MNPISFKRKIKLFYSVRSWRGLLSLFTSTKLSTGIFLFSLFFISCKNSTNPPLNNGPDTTTHNYKWEVDTLYGKGAMQIGMNDIWGTDENNVWVIGHSDYTDYQIWHWEGEKWSYINPKISGDSPSYFAIYGFSEDDFWVVGTGAYINGYNSLGHIGYILHYNSGQWERVKVDSIPWVCTSVWGTSSDNLFVGCDSGVVMHKKGKKWIREQTPYINTIISISGVNENEIYATGAINNYMYYLYTYNNEKWITIDSVNTRLPLSQWYFGDIIWALENERLYSAGEDGIYSYNNNSWDKILDGHAFRSVYGSSADNLFAAALFGKVYHFNGSTWKKDDFFDDYYFDTVGNIWCNKNYVFIAVQELYTSYIFRGKKL